MDRIKERILKYLGFREGFFEGLSKEASDLISLQNKYGVPMYNPLKIVLKKGKGIYVWDERGRKYMDFLGGFGALNQGHRHPEIIKAMKEQLKKITLSTQAMYNDQLPLFLKDLNQIFKYHKIIPTNTGSEAIATALKIAKKYGERKRNIPEDKAEIITFKKSYHAINKVSKKDKEFKIVPYGDIKAFKKALSPKTVAVIIEPIMGSIVEIPPKNFLKQVKEEAKKNNTLVIADEIQVGLGRTGKLLASEHDNVKPDILLLGKSLSGGLYPVSAVLMKKHIGDILKPGDHGSTFGGNPLGTAIARASLKTLLKQKMPENADKLGKYFLGKLKELKQQSSKIKKVKGKGLLIGIELNDEVNAEEIQNKLARKGLLVGKGKGMLRISPPLIVNKKEIDKAVDILKSVLK